jgi:ribosomal protein S6--L-glutamate ligase
MITAGREAWTASPPGAAHRARRTIRTLRVGVAVEERYLSQREPAALVAQLAARGHAVELLEPERLLRRPHRAGAALAGLDAIVARGRSAPLLALLRRAERLGVPVVNPPAAIAAVQDKLGMARVLEAGQVPTPRTHAASVARLLATLDDASFPLVVKPVRGDNGRDVVLLRSRAELAALRWSEPVALAQPFVPGRGRDLKLYVAGEAVWAVLKASPLLDAGWREAPPERVPVTPEMRALALRCGALFGLDLYGLDCIEAAEGLVVVEVNDFPNYSGLPEADARAADLVATRALARAAARSAP